MREIYIYRFIQNYGHLNRVRHIKIKKPNFIPYFDFLAPFSIKTVQHQLNPMMYGFILNLVK